MQSFFSTGSSFAFTKSNPSRMPLGRMKLARNSNFADVLSSIHQRYGLLIHKPTFKYMFMSHYATEVCKCPEKIPTLAFDGCDKLSVVDMSQCINLKEIEGAFNGYTFPSNIDVFLIGATVPPKTSDRSFEYNSIKTLKVPAESVEAYNKSSWKHYALEIKPIDK